MQFLQFQPHRHWGQSPPCPWTIFNDPGGLSLKSRQNPCRICETPDPPQIGLSIYDSYHSRIKKKMDPSDINQEITSLFTNGCSVKTCDWEVAFIPVFLNWIIAKAHNKKRVPCHIRKGFVGHEDTMKAATRSSSSKWDLNKYTKGSLTHAKVPQSPYKEALPPLWV